MNPTGIQLLVIPFAIFLIYVSFIHYKKNLILIQSLFFWISLWFCFIIITLFPQILDPIIIRLNFFRALDLLMVIAFMILVILNYYNYLQIQKAQKQLNVLIGKMTIIRPFKRRRK